METYEKVGKTRDEWKQTIIVVRTIWQHMKNFGKKWRCPWDENAKNLSKSGNDRNIRNTSVTLWQFNSLQAGKSLSLIGSSSIN